MAKIDVIVTEAGFYAGTWYDKKKSPQRMEGKVAKAFLPPAGHQLALPETDAQAGRAEAKAPARPAESGAKA